MMAGDVSYTGWNSCRYSREIRSACRYGGQNKPVGPVMMHSSLFVFDIETVPDIDVLPQLTGETAPDPETGRKMLEDYHLEITSGRNGFPVNRFTRSLRSVFCVQPSSAMVILKYTRSKNCGPAGI